MYFNRHTLPNIFCSAKRIFRSLFAKDEPVIADNRTQAIREARCQLCPHFDHGQCKLCTCFVDLKVIFATEECPALPKRWKRQTRFSNGL
jgi:hypothetical protein